jgi:AraC family transcriptional regulator
MRIVLDRGAFFGRTHRSRIVAGIRLTESVYRPGVVLAAHAHVASYFDVVLDGFCSEVVDGQSRERGRWSLAFHPAGELHSNRWHADAARTFQIEVASPVLDRLCACSPNLDRPTHFGTGPSRWLIQRLYEEFCSNDQVSDLAVEGLTLELLAEGSRWAACRTGRTPPPWLRQVCDLLHERFRHRVTLAEIAEAVGVHPAHLARAFRRVYRCTIGDYVRNLRIEHACHYLRTSESSLATIALAAGFADQSHFSKAFKRRTGMTPAEFRKTSSPRKSDANNDRIVQDRDGDRG